MKRIIASLGLAIGVLLCAEPAAAGIAVTFTPSSQHVNVGDMVKVDVGIAGLGAEILSAFDLNFFYNGSIIGSTRMVNANSAFNQLGGAYGASPIFDFDVFSLGEWGLQASAVADDDTIAFNQDDSFLLASFTFSADADGATSFALGTDLDFERNFVGMNFSTLDVSVNSACIAVGTGQCNVPEPASFGLVGVALLGALAPAALRRRKSS